MCLLNTNALATAIEKCDLDMTLSLTNDFDLGTKGTVLPKEYTCEM